MGFAVLGLAFLAGLLSILSPCVLPLVPIVFATAASGHRYGPLALAAGVTLSFVAIGLFVATIGFSLGLDGGTFRIVGAVLMILAGLVLALPSLQAPTCARGRPDRRLGGRANAGACDAGFAGQFGVGLLLGAVWSPCAGPTLGAASALAAEGQSLGAAALTMTVFGFGAALPLAPAGLASRAAFVKWRGTLLSGGKTAKAVFGMRCLCLELALSAAWTARSNLAGRRLAGLADAADDGVLNGPG